MSEVKKNDSVQFDIEFQTYFTLETENSRCRIHSVVGRCYQYLE